jgi:hypothetical protein
MGAARPRADVEGMLRRLLGFGHVHRSVPLKTLLRYSNASWRDSATRS